MASIANDKNGTKRILFYDLEGARQTIRLGKVSDSFAQEAKVHIERLIYALQHSDDLKPSTRRWVAECPEKLKAKLVKFGLIEADDSTAKKAKSITALEHVADYIERVGKNRKPGTVEVWRQVERNLEKHLPKGIKLADVKAGHAKEVFEAMKARNLASLTIAKHIRIARQMFHDAVNFGMIEKNPFSAVKVSSAASTTNVFVERSTIDQVFKFCDLPWKLIIGLCRYAGMRCPSEVLSLKWSDVDWEEDCLKIYEPKVEHHANRGVRVCPIFPELKPILEAAWDAAAEGAVYVVDKSSYRAAANTGKGWKSTNLRTQFERILEKAGVAQWKRLFHSMRASRQTELERVYPLHVVCAWLGNSPEVARKSYLLTTDDDWTKAKSEATGSIPKWAGTDASHETSQSVAKSDSVSASIKQYRDAINQVSPEVLGVCLGFYDMYQRMGRDSNPR